MRFVALFSLALVIAGLGCSADAAQGSAVDVFPSAPLALVDSASRAYHVEVRTSPNQPPTRGRLQVELRIRDADERPVDGLALSVATWMPAMDHGASVVPEVVALGGGAYRLDEVDLFMPGKWELRTSVAEDPVVVTVPVQ